MNDFVSLVQLSDPEDPLYIKFRETYAEIYKDNTGNSGSVKFLGGQPTTLTNEHVTSLTIEDHYYVSPKLDGERMLLMTMRDVQEIESADGSYVIDDTKFCLIDRELNFYIPRSRDGTYMHDKKHIAGKINDQFINSWKNDQMVSKSLIDGELLILGQDGEFYKNHSQVRRSDVKRYVFFAFDMLYGPTVITPKIEYGFYVHEYGNFSSMQGPRIMGRNIKGEYGQIHRGWSYERRHDQLNMFVDRDDKIQENLQKLSPLGRYFHEFVKWFVVISKKIYELKQISEEYNLIQRRMSFQQYVIRQYKSDLTNQINNIKNNIIYSGGEPIDNYFSIQKLNFDGIIFTPKHGQYKMGPAIACLNTTFKYKEESTVDLIMHRGKLSARDRKKLVKVDNVVHTGLREGEVAEFTYSRQKKWQFSELRPDKTKPNSIQVINNVINSIENPVNLRDITKIIAKKDLSNNRQIVKNHFKTKIPVSISPFILFFEDNVKSEVIGNVIPPQENQIIKMRLSDDQLEAIALMFKYTFDNEYKYFKCKDEDEFIPVEGEGKVYNGSRKIEITPIRTRNKLTVRGEIIYKEVTPDYVKSKDITYDIVEENIIESTKIGISFNRKKYKEFNVLENEIFKLEKIYIYKPHNGTAKRDSIINEFTMKKYDLFTLYMIFYYLSIY